MCALVTGVQTCALPISRRRLDALSRASARRAGRADGMTRRMAEAKTILLVEDDPAIAMIIRETLLGECGHFASVASLAERNAWLADHRADLVITDVVLPDGDGIDSLAHTGIDPMTPDRKSTRLNPSHSSTTRMPF